MSARAPDAGPARIAVAGGGAVGGAFVELWLARAQRDPGLLLRGAGARARLERVLVRDIQRPRAFDARAVVVDDDLADFLASGADIVVEAIGGIEPALTIARATLDRGASFVTANKALVARHGVELERRATRAGGRLLFDAAVGGGVPVVRTLREALPGARVRRVRGSLNGTCTFLLSAMEAGRSYEAALADARRLGYAERDATRDLDGRDAADKVAILAWLAWGVDPAAVEVAVTGLLPDPGAWVRRAEAVSMRVRLVAEVALEDGRVRARVGPVLVPPSSALGRIGGIDNHVEIATEDAGTYALSGPGAGGRATAGAVLADVDALLPPHGARPLQLFGAPSRP